MSEDNIPVWRQPGWLERVQSWVATTLADREIEQSSALEVQKDRPWSIVLRIPTRSGLFYFKACSTATSFEPSLTQLLYQWMPTLVPEVLAIDMERGWMLMSDHGTIAREAYRSGLSVEKWCEILSGYASLQIMSSNHVDELLAAGVRDRRLQALPGIFREMVRDHAWFLIDQEEGITSSEYEVLIRAIDYLEDICQNLSTYNIPAALHHNDLHDGNVFLDNEHFLIFDWGDSSLSHPFFSLRTAFVSVENTFELEENHPVFARLASAYLEAWLNFESRERLEQAFSLAKRIWAVSSAIKYWTIFSQLTEFRDYFASAVPALAKEFLVANPELSLRNTGQLPEVSSNKIP